MPAVIAVLLVVVCEPDLLHCAPVKAWGHLWETAESCRLYLDEGDRFERSLMAETPDPAGRFLF